jgi:hypothetical protein
MGKAASEHGGSTATIFMGVLYIGLMMFCLWAAGDERANYASACRRISDNCTRPIVGT